MFWRVRVSRGAALSAGAIAIAVVVLVLVVGPQFIWGGDSSTDTAAAGPLAPPPWAADTEFKPGSDQSARTTSPTPAAKPAPIDPETGMPAASAGSNGSFTPPPPGERK